MEIRAQVIGGDELARKIAPSRLLGPPTRAFTAHAGEMTRDAIRDEAPDGVTHQLKGSLDFESDQGMPSLWARAFTNLDYAAAVDKGSRPHTPPIAAITPYALAMGIPPGALWQRIRQFGTKPNRFMERGLARAQPRIQALVTVMARSIENRFGGG